MQYAQKEFGLKELKFIQAFGGARAASYDYFPVIGTLIDAERTIEAFPYLKKGSKVPVQKFIHHKNLYILNGVGGRGFVLSPYLAYELSEHIINGKLLDEHLTSSRLFTRYARKL
jgi:glycine/D-amino acid oxidase-like deaminating enzyme